MAFVTANGVCKSYLVGSAPLTVLRDLDLAVAAGEMVAIVGASGVGKSTLLHVLGGLDRADAGQVLIGDASLTALPDAAVVLFRNQHVGFVFQSTICCPNLPPSKTLKCRCGSRAAPRQGRGRGP